MHCPDIVWMVIPPGSTHTLWFFVVWHDVVVVGELLVADCTFLVLLDNFPVQEFPPFCWRPEFPISSWVMRIFDPLDTEP